MRLIIIIFTVLLTLYWLMAEAMTYNEMGFTYNVGLGLVLTALYAYIFLSGKDPEENKNP